MQNKLRQASLANKIDNAMQLYQAEESLSVSHHQRAMTALEQWVQLKAEEAGLVVGDFIYASRWYCDWTPMVVVGYTAKQSFGNNEEIEWKIKAHPIKKDGEKHRGRSVMAIEGEDAEKKSRKSRPADTRLWIKISKEDLPRYFAMEGESPYGNVKKTT